MFSTVFPDAARRNGPVYLWDLDRRAGGHTLVRLGAFPTAVPFYERMGMSVRGYTTGTGVLAGRTWALMEKELVPDLT